MKLKRGYLIVLAVLTGAGAVFGGISPNHKLMAKRAAELDAYRNMAERIMGLRISSESRVLDYVAQSDRIATHMDHFIKGLRIDPNQISWYDDGTCEVAVQVTLSRVVKELKTTVDKYYKGGKWTDYQMDSIETNTKQRVLTAYGTGAVRENSVIAEPQSIPVVMEFTNPRDKKITLPGIYRSYPPRNRLMAKRIATLDAYRKLVERIYGLKISSETTVSNFDVNMSSDLIRGMLDHNLKGMRIEEVRYQSDGIVEVQASLTLKQVVKTLKKVCDEYYDITGKKIKTDRFEEIEKQTKRRTIVVLGMGAIQGSGRPAHSTYGINAQPTRSGTEKKTKKTIIVEEPEVIVIE